MAYTVEYRARAKKNLRKIDASARRMIRNWIEKNLQGCDDPRRHGKPMTGNHRGEWRYRVGVYRILAEIHDDKLLILVIDIGHRQGIYHQ